MNCASIAVSRYLHPCFTSLPLLFTIRHPTQGGNPPAGSGFQLSPQARKTQPLTFATITRLSSLLCAHGNHARNSVDETIRSNYSGLHDRLIVDLRTAIRVPESVTDGLSEVTDARLVNSRGIPAEEFHRFRGPGRSLDWCWRLASISAVSIILRVHCPRRIADPATPPFQFASSLDCLSLSRQEQVWDS